jgi:RNA polymerase sigma-70 factor, ECF subfamily
MEPLELEATVERCREGDESAWSALVSTTLRPIYRLCASYAPSAAEAEELTQEVYFKLWENLHQYAPGSNFMAWAWRVARNLLIDSYRRCHRERSAAWLDPEIIERLPATDDPHEESLRRQRLRLVATGLRQLPEELASLILMRDLAGWSYSEIAEALDLPAGTVKSRLNRARLELATIVRRRMQIRVVPPAGTAAEGGA